jgi:hypothetical protein
MRVVIHMGTCRTSGSIDIWKVTVTGRLITATLAQCFRAAPQTVSGLGTGWTHFRFLQYCSYPLVGQQGSSRCGINCRRSPYLAGVTSWRYRDLVKETEGQGTTRRYLLGIVLVSYVFPYSYPSGGELSCHSPDL